MKFIESLDSRSTVSYDLSLWFKIHCFIWLVSICESLFVICGL